ncbi:hypothetical protein B0I21_10287 [Sphingobacterium paludis]|uniref:Uncharacterized protein n=1 Tax=Sphingobacterium paludis TaxID=1476465 RepID=A0A4R7D6F1_9SPHI|nr:hypothetical protein B0I21_10287 [Sphingobacterium paludis]
MDEILFSDSLAHFFETYVLGSLNYRSYWKAGCAYQDVN